MCFRMSRMRQEFAVVEKKLRVTAKRDKHGFEARVG